MPSDSYELQNCKSDHNSETPDVGRGSPDEAPTQRSGAGPGPFCDFTKLHCTLVEVIQDYKNGTRLRGAKIGTTGFPANAGFQNSLSRCTLDWLIKFFGGLSPNFVI